MKNRTNIFRIPMLLTAMVLALTVALLGVTTVAMAAEEKAAETTATPFPESSDASGIKVTTSTDKKQYGDGDTAEVTVSVTNTNSYDMTNVGVKYELPVNMKSTHEQKEQKIDVLKAGETKVFKLTAEVTKDSNADIVISSYFTLPTILILLVVVVIIVAVIAMISRKKGKKNKGMKTGVSMFLVMALLASSLSYSAIPAKADEVEGLEVEETTEDGEVTNNSFLPRVSVHDPSIVKDPKTGTYYIFGSHRAFAKSDDLMSWKTFSTNVHTDYAELFAEPWAWAEFPTPQSSGTLNGRMWAPDVIWNETMGKWCMYMSIDGDNWCSAICLLTADNIEGPYEYKDIVVYSGMNNSKTPPTNLEDTDIYKVLDKSDDLDRYRSTSNSCINAIDPCVRYDDDGNLYMVYGSWSAGIYMLKLDNETGLRDYNEKYETKIYESDAYLGVKIAGGHYNSGEAPYILKAGDYYYLFISYAGLEAVGGYQMRIYRSKEITGPYVDQAGNSAICKKAEDMKRSTKGVKIFGSYEMSGLPQVQVAQGHNSAFVDDDGKIHLVYHTRFQSNSGKVEFHQVRVHQMFVNEDGWLVAAPYEYSGETLPEKGYTAEEVAGEYDFIYHEPTEYYNVVEGEQFGIIGDEEETVMEVTVQKDMVIAHRKAVVECTVTYGHEGSAKVILNKDGTVSGDYAGTWKATKGANVEMNLNGVTYKGVFLKQKDESMERKERMTFSLVGNNVAVWGVTADKAEEVVAE